MTDGCEKNISNDAGNCGVCGKVCAVGNGTAKCDAKVCKVDTCAAPWADCDGDGLDCETNTSSNSANCGGCGSNGLNCNTVFGALHASGKCLASACQFDKCAANFADCNLNPDVDGCEVNLNTNGSHCGSCGATCQAPHGANSCVGGSCAPNCGAPFGDCDGDVKTGCEAVFASDGENCGACDTVCQQNNASNPCLGGSCTPTCAQPYFKSCDGNGNNGCEVDTRTSKTNCGGCALACADNQTMSNNCLAGVCQAVCLPNHASCDGNPSNGCETPTATDPANCGNCNVQCKALNAARTMCVAGACSPACNDGFAACATPAAGCAISIDSAAHCGNCTTVCSGSKPFCVSRACASNLDIGVVSSAIASSGVTGQNLVVPHVLQTSAAANPYRLLIVGVTGSGNPGASLPINVQYNNVNMLAARVIQPANQVSAAIYYLPSASLPPLAGPYNVLLTSAGSNSFALTANVLELINVEQATGALDAVGGQASSSTCSAHTPSDAVNVTTIGDLIYSVASVSVSGTDPAPNSSGQTITEQTKVGSLSTFAGYLKATATGSRTITWTIGTCNASAHALLSIKPASTP